MSWLTCGNKHIELHMDQEEFVVTRAYLLHYDVSSNLYVTWFIILPDSANADIHEITCCNEELESLHWYTFW